MRINVAQIFNRRVILTSLDPVPRAFRAVPGWLALNTQEFEAFRQGEPDTVRLVVDICQAEDAAEVHGVYKYPKQKRTPASGRKAGRGKLP